MAEFTIGDYDYKSSPMDAMTQFKVARRLAPALTAFSDYNAEAMKLTTEPVEGQDEAVIAAASKASANRMIEVAGKAIGMMSDEATDYILAACLARCQRRRTGPEHMSDTWAEVWNKTSNRPQHMDINMGVMLQIAVAVLKEALADFFPESLSSFKGGSRLA